MKVTMKTTTKDGKGPPKKKKGQKITHIKGGERFTPK